MKKISSLLCISALYFNLFACSNPSTTDPLKQNTSLKETKSFKTDELIFNGKVFKSGSTLDKEIIDGFFPEFIKGRKWSYKSVNKFEGDENSPFLKMLKPYFEKLANIDQNIEVLENNGEFIKIKTSSDVLKEFTGKDSEETQINLKEFEEMKKKIYTFTPEGTTRSAQMSQQPDQTPKIEFKYKFLGNEEIKILDKKFAASKISFTIENEYLSGTGESLFIKSIGTYKSNSKMNIKMSGIEFNMNSDTQLVGFTEAK